MNRRGATTPAKATATLAANRYADSHRAAADRHPANATATIGARSGRAGTRNRAGALEPPHHMYILVELATNVTIVAISASANNRRFGRRSIIHPPAIATRYTGAYISNPNLCSNSSP